MGREMGAGCQCSPFLPSLVQTQPLECHSHEPRQEKRLMQPRGLYEKAMGLKSDHVSSRKAEDKCDDRGENRIALFCLWICSIFQQPISDTSVGRGALRHTGDVKFL